MISPLHYSVAASKLFLSLWFPVETTLALNWYIFSSGGNCHLIRMNIPLKKVILSFYEERAGKQTLNIWYHHPLTSTSSSLRSEFRNCV